MLLEMYSSEFLKLKGLDKGCFDLDEHYSLGKLLAICSQSVRHQRVNLLSFFSWVRPAILHNQFAVIWQGNEIKPSGYIMWAWVNDETLNRYFTETKFFLHPSEWNEGNYLIVVDFCCLFNSRKVISSLLKDSKITQGNRVHYCVRNEKGIPVKSSNRSRL